MWTADYGLSLGEHGVVGPVPTSAHEEIIHLPLILSLPGADEAGRRVAALTQAVDLAPTLADVFEVELPSAQGRTLLPLVYGDAEQIRPYVCSGVQNGDIGEWCLRTPEYALLLPMQAEAGGRGCTSSRTTVTKSTMSCNITWKRPRRWSGRCGVP